MRSFLLILSGLLLSAVLKAQYAFEIKVNKPNLKQGTKCWISYGDKRDSVLSGNGQIIYKGELTDTEPVNAFVHFIEKDDIQYVGFWLGPGTTTINAIPKRPLNRAIVEGHVYNTEVSELKRMTAALERKMERLQAKAEKLLAKGRDSAIVIAKYQPILEKLEAEEEQISRNYIRMYPERSYSQAMLHTSCKVYGPDTTRALLALMPETFRQSSEGQDIQRYLELNVPIEVGAVYTDITQPDSLGNPMALSSLQGKWLLLEFWASWCGPCRIDIPALRQVYAAFQPKGLEIYAVSLDTDKKMWLKAIADDNLPWVHVSDLKGSYNLAALTYGIYGIPNNFLISPEGKIVAKDLKPRELAMKLEEVMK